MCILSVASDLLRVCVCVWLYEFCDKVLGEISQSLVSPVRLSGSPVETLFSQFKHTAGSATNYANTRATHLIKHCVATHHSSA